MNVDDFNNNTYEDDIINYTPPTAIDDSMVTATLVSIKDNPILKPQVTQSNQNLVMNSTSTIESLRDDEDVFKVKETEDWIGLVVKQFLEHCYDNCDGWEWMKNSEGSLVIAVDDDLGNKWNFTYSLDWEPSFGVYEVKKS